MKLHLRIIWTFLLVLATGLAVGTRAFAESDPLPPWNDGPVKQEIIEFAQ